MKTFQVPTRDQVSPVNQAIFDGMLKSFGKVPNLYATFALNETALADYLALQNRKSTLSFKEREAINLLVSQLNGCQYCVPAHLAVGKMAGFSDAQLGQIRGGGADFDPKLNALLRFVQETTLSRGRPSDQTLDAFYEAGYSQANLIDVVINIGDKIISNYLHNITNIAVDWPAAPEIG